MQVPEPASTALGEHDSFAVMGQVGDDLTAVDIGDDGADRHAQDDIVRAFAIAIGAAAGLAVLGAVHARKAVIHQGVDVAVGNGDHTASAAAVAAVRSALVDVFFVTKAGRAVAAVACDDFNF